jgi:hypothetical protein
MEPKNSAKVFSFVDSPDSSRVKSHRGRHNGGVAPEGAIRAATDRAVKDRKHPLYRCSGRTYLGNRLIPSSWPIDSQNRWRDRTELEPNPPILNAPEADMLKRRLKHAAAPLKPLNESPVTPTAEPRNFMTGAARRFYWRTWKEMPSSAFLS